MEKDKKQKKLTKEEIKKLRKLNTEKQKVVDNKDVVLKN